MDYKIKVKSNIIKPYSNKNPLNKNPLNKNPLNHFMSIYFNNKITPSVYESIVKQL